MHPIVKYRLLYPVYLLITLKDIVVGKAQLRKQLRGDVMVLKHRTALIALLIHARNKRDSNPRGGANGRGAGIAGEEADGVDPALRAAAEVGPDAVEEMAWGAMELDRDEADVLETLLDIRRRTFRDYFEAKNPPISSGPDANGPGLPSGTDTGAAGSGSESGSRTGRSVFPWAKKTMDLLNEAESRSLFRTEDAFRAYFEARRLLLYGLEELDEDAVRIRARSVVERARGLSDETRRKTVEGLLLENGDLRADLGIHEVLEANEVLHAHYLDVYRRMESIRINILNFLANTLLAIVLIVFLFEGVVDPSVVDNPSSTYEAQRFLVLVMVFGVMGASISGLLTAEEGSQATRYLEQVLGSWLAIARAIIGAASALLVYVLFLVGLPLGNTVPQAPLILGVSFAAGFSERLLIRTIGTLESLGPGAK
jgi:hypothetical protein